MAINQQPSPKRVKKYSIGSRKGHEMHYLDAETADVWFTFGTFRSDSSSSARVPAHKIILARDSDVFKRIFYGGLKETGDIHLTDASAAACKVFLQCFYFTDMKLTFEHVADVMYLGKKYNIADCIDVCVKFFKDKQNAKHILIGLSMGLLYSHSELILFCERYIARNTNAIMQSNVFLECDRNMLEHILNANLFVCREDQLFMACMEWVKAKSGYETLTIDIVDEHLGRLFNDFRFGAMTIQQFCNLFKKYPSVLSNDYQTITQLIGLPHEHQNQFNTQPRQIKWTVPDGALLECHREKANGYEGCIKAEAVEGIQFSVSKSLLLTGFTCNASKFVVGNREILVKAKIVRFFLGQPEVFLKFTAKLCSINRTNIVLQQPILIEANRNYMIFIKFPHDFHGFLYHSHELKEKVQLESGAIVTFKNCKKNSDDSKVVGIIPALEFSRI